MKDRIFKKGDIIIPNNKFKESNRWRIQQLKRARVTSLPNSAGYNKNLISIRLTGGKATSSDHHPWDARGGDVITVFEDAFMLESRKEPKYQLW